MRSSKYLNNLIEQDHRHIKSRANVMRGLKRFINAQTTISGIELMHRIRKGQFDLSALALEDITAPPSGMPSFSIDKASISQGITDPLSTTYLHQILLDHQSTFDAFVWQFDCLKLQRIIPIRGGWSLSVHIPQAPQ
ncbi:hypothetical protein OKW38_000322 [Paraburkholderia sp. MM5496-R1]|nr:hypothetical protein [Paraburkholderia sp. HC6.4b]MBB5453869.1 hypothetical protein [Paraburkholderia sp. Kb1A]